MSDKIYVGQKCTTFRSMGEYPPVSRVTMWTDDEHYYTAGDDTGYEISVPCRSAKQEIVDAALKQLKGFVYRPFEATGVAIDPAYEPGDAVTINGIYSFIGQDTRHFNAMGLSDISCPGEREIDHEYPYKSPQERELKRRVKLEQAYFGAKISRREGLVIEKLEQEIIKARVVLNAEKLAFYGPNDEEQLYFDPVEGIYKFRGALNVSDKFLVDKLGNVTLAGNVRWTKDTFPIQSEFSADGATNWHPTMGQKDKYRRDKTSDGTWGEPYQFLGVDGRPGANGSDGSDASVTRNNILLAMLKALDDDGLYVFDGDDGKQYIGLRASAIKAGALSAIDIEGCHYFSENRVGKLVLSDASGRFSDMSFTNGQTGTEIFSVSDNIGGATLYLYGKPVIHSGIDGVSLDKSVKATFVFA